MKEIFEANVLQLETGEWIRLLGIQPTRKVEVRRAAIDWMLQEVKGKAVKLEYDKQLHDAMGRMLAYVTLETTPPQTGPIQEDLLWRGLVYTSKRYPCKQFSRFRRYEKEARKAKRGIWEGI
ncbi:MAG: thermonuclease family protein [Candidatus Omnitrophica bacterium]|nr:thermonuclease family protein [Candidatus Omnitrophota bacterium]